METKPLIVAHRHRIEGCADPTATFKPSLNIALGKREITVETSKVLGILSEWS